MHDFWMPHGHCFFWEPGVLWLHVISDAIIALSYYSIPLALAYFLYQRKDMIHKWVIWLFALFILSCGTGHAFAILTMWHPLYFYEGVIKACTALVSVVTAVAVWPLIPRLLSLPSPTQLERMREKNERLKKENERLRK